MRRAQLIGLAVIVVASGLWATPAVGQSGAFGTGNTLITLLKDLLDEKTHWGTGYAVGVVRATASMAATNDNPSYRKMCAPDDVIYNQFNRVVYNYLVDHPEQLHFNDVVLIQAALVEAWPCSP